MPYAFRVALPHRIAYVKSQPFRRDKPGRKLARMKSDVSFFVLFLTLLYSVYVVEHRHLQREIVHRCPAIFRLYEVQSDQPRIGFRRLHRGHHLRKCLAVRGCPRDLEDVADDDLAARARTVRIVAREQLTALRLYLVEHSTALLSGPIHLSLKKLLPLL